MKQLAMRLGVMAVLFYGVWPVSGWAEDMKVPLFKFGAEMRLRSETLAHFDSFTPTRTQSADDSFVLLRLRPYMEANPTQQIHLFVQPQFSRRFAEEESTLANNQAIDDFDLHQAYVDFTQLGGSGLSVRAGRQELSYGDERLIGALDWSNTGRNFDAGKISYAFEDGWVDGFGSWIQRSGGNQYFGGIYGHFDIGDAFDEEPYALLLRDNDGGIAGDALTVYTIGNRFAGTVAKTWDYAVEAALQLGTSGTADIFAYAGHVRGGYTFDQAAWKPRLGLEYNAASGDGSPTSGKVTTFNNLFPTNHNKYGYMDLVGWRNMHNPAASFQVNPVPNLSLGVMGHAFLLMESADGLYQASGARVRAGASGASRYVGSEIDTTLTYKWNQYARFLVGYSFFKAGEFMGDTGLARDAHFVYAQTQVRFDYPLK